MSWFETFVFGKPVSNMHYAIFHPSHYHMSFMSNYRQSSPYVSWILENIQLQPV